MSEPTLSPQSDPVSAPVCLNSLLFDALGGDDTHRVSLLLSFMIADPERTAKLAEFEQELRHAEPRS